MWALVDLFLEIVLALEIALAMWVFYEETGGEGDLFRS